MCVYVAIFLLAYSTAAFRHPLKCCSSPELLRRGCMRELKCHQISFRTFSQFPKLKFQEKCPSEPKWEYSRKVGVLINEIIKLCSRFTIMPWPHALLRCHRRFQKCSYTVVNASDLENLLLRSSYVNSIHLQMPGPNFVDIFRRVVSENSSCVTPPVPQCSVKHVEHLRVTRSIRQAVSQFQSWNIQQEACISWLHHGSGEQYQIHSIIQSSPLPLFPLWYCVSVCFTVSSLFRMSASYVLLTNSHRSLLPQDTASTDCCGARVQQYELAVGARCVPVAKTTKQSI